jgi:hypothetical protein
MIRRLTLKNWRNYQDVTVEFGVGTTFVVASNGMGRPRWSKLHGGHSLARLCQVAMLRSALVQSPPWRL